MMNRVGALRIVSIIIAVISLFGCEASLKEIRARSVSTSTGVFKELLPGESTPEGDVRLQVTASIKTHLKGYYLETSKSLHGKPGYPFVFNIDGQAVTWKIDGTLDITPTYDEEGRRTAEGGEGIRYLLDKIIALKPGPHEIFLGLSQEPYLVQFRLVLPDKGQQVLEFVPVYAHSYRRRFGFLYGITDYEVFLNGERINLTKGDDGSVS